jgi:hypothetical protein
MRSNSYTAFRIFIIILVACFLLSNSQVAKSDVHSNLTTTLDTVCRFGITSPLGSDGYDIVSLGVGSYLDWGAVTNPVLPFGVEYMRVLRLRNDIYPTTLANLPAWVEANPGSVWVVGNEPDTTYGDQDALLPEVYAERYIEVAKIIRHLDKTAQIAFGSVVQPTPIRLRYLDRAWNELVAEIGSPDAASRLIDIWSIHSFILNEEPGAWGTGIPPGFENDHNDAVIITNLDDTFSINIYQSRVIAFRGWMARIGEREKPLWITEYGSLMPPIDPPGGPNYYNVSDEDTSAFMLATFDFMLSATNAQTGLPADENQLVQRWYWYSLNDYRYNFGGTIYDPDNGKLPTLVGEAFIDYQSLNLVPVDLFPASLSIAPISYSPGRTLVNYRLDITIENDLFQDATCAQVWIYDGDPNAGGTLIAGPIPASAIQSNYGNGKLSAYWMGVQPLMQHTLYVQVDPIHVSDTHPENNLAAFSVYLDLPKLNFLTFILR